jgi:hypothetical protein
MLVANSNIGEFVRAIMLLKNDMLIEILLYLPSQG